MQLSEAEILSIVSEGLPDFHPTGALQPLEGGNLNYVWRLVGKQKNLIVKVAPPYIAANPEVPLSVNRIRFEANAMRLFQAENRLHSLCSENVRPPFIEFYDRKNNLLVMEDVGSLPHLGVADLSNGQYASFGSTLGKFIAGLHMQTFEDAEPATEFNNIDIQETRLEVQYNPAADYLKKTWFGDVDSNLVSQKTKAVGHKLLAPGKCLVMGDLWPPSILVDGENIRLIDWEFVHYGRPLQDVGHLAAHCWMLAHTASQEKVFRELWQQFWDAYRNEVGGRFNVNVDDLTTHMGAEILVRAAGPFKDGYVYADYEPGHPLLAEAGQKAKELILGDDLSLLWT